MNTNDKYELPPLPAQRVLRRVMPDDFRYGDVCGYTEGQLKAYARSAIETDRRRRGNNQEPFGYFRATPFGWEDCAPTDDGAIALYESPRKSIDSE